MKQSFFFFYQTWLSTNCISYRRKEMEKGNQGKTFIAPKPILNIFIKVFKFKHNNFQENRRLTCTFHKSGWVDMEYPINSYLVVGPLTLFFFVPSNLASSQDTSIFSWSGNQWQPLVLLSAKIELALPSSSGSNIEKENSLPEITFKNLKYLKKRSNKQICFVL